MARCILIPRKYFGLRAIETVALNVMTVIARRLGFCVGIFLLFLLPFGQLAFQAVYLCFVRIVLLSVHRRIFHARLGDFFQQVGILILQRIDLRLKDGHLLLRLLQHGVQLG